MYRLRHAERKAYMILGCTSDLGCVFCLPETFFGERIALCTRRGAFAPFWGLFSWKALEYESNGKFCKTERSIFKEHFL